MKVYQRLAEMKGFAWDLIFRIRFKIHFIVEQYCGNTGTGFHWHCANCYVRDSEHSWGEESLLALFWLHREEWSHWYGHIGIRDSLQVPSLQLHDIFMQECGWMDKEKIEQNR